MPSDARQSSIYPVLLCGGSGTRLWPVSRQSYPKQFARLTGGDSLFQASAKRLSGAGFGAPVVLTGEDFRFIVSEQLDEAAIQPEAILIEPDGRNTAPAILAAALHINAYDPGALMLVAPSDHLIPDAAAFRDTVIQGVAAAQDGALVTFGIQPTRPETGYGYLELANGADLATPTPQPLVSFVEKPDAARAEQMVADGRHLWNSGIFLFSAGAILRAFEAHAPDMLAPARAALSGAESDLDFHRLAAEPWSQLPDISIDFAVMEKADKLTVVPFAGDWSDLGGWDAIWGASQPDADGVVATGPATALDCQNTLLRSDDEAVQVVGIGLKNIVAVATPDAVLVADMSRAQDVKSAVTALKAKGASQATMHPRSHRPWGWFETLVLGDRFQVKRIVVKPGGILSLQSHMHRAEHWVVVSGTARVTVGEEVQLVSENESIYVPLGAVHRMENPGRVPMVLIEVQTGTYLGEDDIVRYEDAYKRT